MNQKASTVLVIDDDHNVAELMACFLAQENFRPVIAFDGTAGLQQARALLPALILCDLTMPGMDGAEVIERLRGDPATVHIPIVLMSGHAGAHFDGCGANAFLQKPCHMAELLDVTRKFVLKKPPSDHEISHETLGCAV